VPSVLIHTAGTARCFHLQMMRARDGAAKRPRAFDTTATNVPNVAKADLRVRVSGKTALGRGSTVGAAILMP
jgi:predicted alpha/beta-hydrolase family hydrolase